MSIKKIIYLISSVAIAVMTLLIVYQMGKPTVEVKIEGTHDPLTTKFKINGSPVPPSGPEGKIYKTTLRRGLNTIQIDSPFIEPYTEEIPASFFNRKKLSMQIKKMEPEKIIRSIIQQPADIKKMRVFRKEGVIVASLFSHGKPLVEDNDHPLLFYYDQPSGRWEEIASKLIQNPASFNLSTAVLDYFFEHAND